MTNQDRESTNLKTARIVGLLILTATVAYMIGSGFVDTILTAPDYLLHVHPDRIQLIIGVLIQFVGAAANVSIGVVLFPILKKYSQTVAIGYVATRIFDGAGLLIAGIGTLSLIVLSQEMIQAGTQGAASVLILSNLIVAGSSTTFLVTMMALGLGSLPLCYLLYRTRLIPRPMAALGFIGYVALLMGSAVELFGFNLNMMHFLPGGIFELILPLWLIVKGFSPSAIASQPTRTDATTREQMSLANV